MKKIADLITIADFENKPAKIRIDYYSLDNISVEYDGSFADLIGLGADIYCALVEQIVSKNLLDDLLLDRCLLLKTQFKNAEGLKKKGYIDFKIDKKSNITSKLKGNGVALAAAYCYFIESICQHYDISYHEYLEKIKNNYESWRVSEKRRVFYDGLNRG